MTVYSGEVLCGGWVKSRQTICGKPAYYIGSDGTVACGRHDHLLINPKKLPVNVEKIERLRAAQYDLAEAAMKKNQSLGLRGEVTVAKMFGRFHVPQPEPGFVLVYPNFVAGFRKANGIPAPALSPMSLGPVTHDHPGLPPACNIENYWNGSKLFGTEVDSNGEPLPIWYERRLAKWLDPVPARWKLGKTKAEHLEASGGVSNAIGAIYWDSAIGKERHYSYLEARQFYAGWYEKLSRLTPDYTTLMGALDEGWNLTITGPDVMKGGLDGRTNDEYYRDPSSPFGHEMCLRAVLLGEHPWRD